MAMLLNMMMIKNVKHKKETLDLLKELNQS